MNWDGQNPAREEGEALIARILAAKSLADVQDAAQRLARISRPFLNWAGKAERLSFDVPTLPLFVHERLSTRAILESVKRHRANNQMDAFELFGDPKHDYADQLRSYEHREGWVNRMILGDSLVVMNSLLQYEGMGGQVQMIYIDPPYGVKFGSNFQPFVRKHVVKHNDDDDMTREPEMVQAYRDTWELGLHSYLTYLRDRLFIARDLLTQSGSVFVQISDENVHHVRELMDEVFGKDRFVSTIAFVKTSSSTSDELSSVYDLLLWYAKDSSQMTYRQLYSQKFRGGAGGTGYTRVQLADGSFRPISTFETDDGELALPPDSSIIALDNITSQNPGSRYDVVLNGRTFRPEPGYWKTDEPRMKRLIAANRIGCTAHKLAYIRRFEDFPYFPMANVWTDTLGQNQFGGSKQYVVQTALSVIQRCILMTTTPGDLVIDPTCGSGTTAYVAEHWGRRWITIDTSRVPLSLARQRLLTATYPWYDLKTDGRGPAGGFVYKRKQNNKGEDVGGIVPHVTLKSIANDGPPTEEVLVDRPEVTKTITRVAGPFAVEATIPTPVDFDNDGVEDSHAETPEAYASFIDRMIEVLRRSPVIQIGGNRSVTLRNVRPPSRALSLSAEATVDATADGQRPTLGEAVDEAEEKRGDRLRFSGKPVAIVFGPENGAVSDKLVFEAAREANAKNYTHLYVIGFAIQANARELIDKHDMLGIAMTYINMTPDLMMGDLLKNMRSSQIFSVCGQPEIEVSDAPPREIGDAVQHQVKLLGLDVFNPADMTVEHKRGDDVPCCMLDTDYDDLCFRATQVFFPRTGAWDNLKRALKVDYDESVWDHLAGDTSAPFSAPAGGKEFKVAVKVIDERGNELLVVRTVKAG
jgi:adenine-specific DNA-methyltransferase